MKNLKISKIIGVTPSKRGMKLKLHVESEDDEVLSITFPHELELDLVLPLQIASNSAAVKRGSKSAGCHRAMRPSRIQILSDTNGTTVMQFTFDGRNKLDVLLPKGAYAQFRRVWSNFDAKERPRSTELVN